MAPWHVRDEERIGVDILDHTEKEVRVERQTLLLEFKLDRSWFRHGEKPALMVLIMFVVVERRCGEQSRRSLAKCLQAVHVVVLPLPGFHRMASLTKTSGTSMPSQLLH